LKRDTLNRRGLGGRKKSGEVCRKKTPSEGKASKGHTKGDLNPSRTGDMNSGNRKGGKELQGNNIFSSLGVDVSYLQFHQKGNKGGKEFLWQLKGGKKRCSFSMYRGRIDKKKGVRRKEKRGIPCRPVERKGEANWKIIIK